MTIRLTTMHPSIWSVMSSREKTLYYALVLPMLVIAYPGFKAYGLWRRIRG